MRQITISRALRAVFLVGLGAGFASADGAAPPSDPKLLAVVEAEKGPYEECMAQLDRDYPPREVKKFPKPKTVEEAKRTVDEALKQAEYLTKRIDGTSACVKSFEGAVAPKLKEAGATNETASKAIVDWRNARDKARASAKGDKKER
jgi:hypothetical protein